MLKNSANSELLKELEIQLATNSFSPPEIQVLAQLLAKNYSQISPALTQALAQEFLAQYGFQKKSNV